MHSPAISSTVDRIFAVLILLVLLAGAYAMVRNYYLEQLTALHQELTLSKKKHAKIDAILVNEKHLGNQIRQFKGQVQKNRLFLNQDNPATAASELQNHVRKLISSNSRAKISAIKPYPAKVYDNYSETSFEIYLLDVSHSDLYRLLHSIESSVPIVLVRELEITVTRRRYKSIAKADEDPANMKVTLVVSGFFRGQPG
jgi:hypothetical protein